MRIERLPVRFELLQKLRARLETRLTGFYYGSLQCGTSDMVHCFAFLFFTFYVFYDICSDDMLTLWERDAPSVYNMFSVPRQEKIIESEQGRRS